MATPTVFLLTLVDSLAVADQGEAEPSETDQGASTPWVNESQEDLRLVGASPSWGSRPSSHWDQEGRRGAGDGSNADKNGRTLSTMVQLSLLQWGILNWPARLNKWCWQQEVNPDHMSSGSARSRTFAQLVYERMEELKVPTATW